MMNMRHVPEGIPDMAGTVEPRPGASAEATSATPEPRHGPPIAATNPTIHPDQPAATPPHSGRRWLLLGGIVVGLAIGAYFLVPWVITALNTISTDDAYVNGHVTFVAPRVGGQVAKVLVDDNYRVKKGDLLVQLDKEPYQVQVEIRKAAVTAADTDLTAAQAQVRGQVAQA